MALNVSSVTTAAVTVVPAKIQSPYSTVLSSSCVILRPPSTFRRFMYHKVPISSRISSVPPKATPRPKYVYPDPIPEFAVAETQKFKAELLKELSKEKETFGHDLNAVLDICAEAKQRGIGLRHANPCHSEENQTYERLQLGVFLYYDVNPWFQIFSEFLRKEYGGPGTLLVEPFTDMLIVLKEKKLPGAPVAARASLLWAQNYVDQDWEIWNSKPPKRF